MLKAQLRCKIENNISGYVNSFEIVFLVCIDPEIMQSKYLFDERFENLCEKQAGKSQKKIERKLMLRDLTSYTLMVL